MTRYIININHYIIHSAGAIACYQHRTHYNTSLQTTLLSTITIHTMAPFQPLSFLLLVCDTRRAFLTTSITICTLPFPPQLAIAEEDNDGNNRDLYLAQPMGIPKDGRSSSSSSSAENLPSAPLEYLLPAARVGVYVYQTLAVAEELENSSNKSQPEAEEVMQRLDNLLLFPPSFITSSDPTVTRGDPYNLPPLLGEIAMQQQKQKERKQQSVEVGMAPQFFEVGELMGERRQWNRLVKAEKEREEKSDLRRALNIYTTNLNFNPSKYKFSGTKEEKSIMIRNDKLPTAKEVIRSDLDARDLYRNALQTALDDAKAEYLYQKKQNNFDTSDLVELLKDACKAIDKWFSFIPDEDIHEALEAVKREQNDLVNEDTS